MKIAPGTLVNQNVRLVRLLGEGGMGSVWVGDHLSLETQVAVKFILPELSKDDPEILARFKREARVAARIKSQHVVQVFDHGVADDDTPFIVMELLEGSSLADWLELQGQLSVADTVTMVEQVASVLSKAHELGVIHRDVKPENIFLVDSEDRLFVKVLDFGIAKQTRLPKGSLRTGTGIVVGTPDFMSPESLLKVGSVDARADLWALAVVAYVALTGARPFLGETVPGIIVAITEGAFERPSIIAPQTVPAALDDWFAQALARDPAERFASAKALAASFAEAARAAPGAEPAVRRGTKPQRLPQPLAMKQTQHAGHAEPVELTPPAAEPREAALDRPARPVAPPKRRKPEDAARAGERAGLMIAGAPLAPAAAGEEGADPFELDVADLLVPAERPAARSVEQPEPRSSQQDGAGAPAWAESLGDSLVTTDPERRRAERMRPAHAATAVPRSTGQSEPINVIDLIKPGLLLCLALGVIPASVEPGLNVVKRILGSATYLGFGAVTVALVVASSQTAAEARRQESAVLYLSSVATALLGACMAVVTGALAAPSSSVVAYQAWAIIVAPLAAAGVALGLGAHGLLRAKDELFGGGGARRSYGVILLVLSLAGIGIAYRMLQRTELLAGLLG